MEQRKLTTFRTFMVLCVHVRTYVLQLFRVLPVLTPFQPPVTSFATKHTFQMPVVAVDRLQGSGAQRCTSLVSTARNMANIEVSQDILLSSEVKYILKSICSLKYHPRISLAICEPGCIASISWYDLVLASSLSLAWERARSTLQKSDQLSCCEFSVCLTHFTQNRNILRV